jgi:hypothetical protein
MPTNTPRRVSERRGQVEQDDQAEASASRGLVATLPQAPNRRLLPSALWDAAVMDADEAAAREERGNHAEDE